MSKAVFVIYDRTTSAILKIRTANGRTTEWYYGHGAAKAALTRYCKKSGLNFTDFDYPLYRYAITDRDHYRKHVEKQVKRVNLMTGAEFYESANTPYCCSPASETYWSA